MLQKITLFFILIIAVALYYILNTDLAQPMDKVKIEQKTLKVKKPKPKQDVSITYDVKQKPKKIQKKDLKKEFQDYASANAEQLHTLSSKKVEDYTLSLKTVTKPKVNKFSPPTLPTIIVGEIDGNRFSLGLNSNVKDQDIFLTITKNGATTVIDASALKNAASGKMVDIGNINPPQDFKNADLTNFAKQTANEIEQNVQESENSANSNQIAPPSPPNLGE